MMISSSINIDNVVIIIITIMIIIIIIISRGSSSSMMMIIIISSSSSIIISSIIGSIMSSVSTDICTWAGGALGERVGWLLTLLKTRELAGYCRFP